MARALARVRALALALTLVPPLCHPHATAAQVSAPRSFSVGPVTAVAWPAQWRLARELAARAALPADYPGLPAVAPAPLRLILAPDGRAIDSLTSGAAPGWGAGIALPDERIILLRADDPEVTRTLRHELAHLALHRAVRIRVPLWFDEGYAATAAKEWERLGGLELNFAVARGAVPDLDALEGALRGSASTADAAYALATAAVSELARRNPTGTLVPLLSRLRAGDGFDRAVLATTGLTMGQFEVVWRERIRRRYGLVVWIIAGGGWSALTLVLWALLRRRRAFDRPRRAALDQGWLIEPEDGGPEATGASELDPTHRP